MHKYSEKSSVPVVTADRNTLYLHSLKRQYECEDDVLHSS